MRRDMRKRPKVRFKAVFNKTFQNQSDKTRAQDMYRPSGKRGRLHIAEDLGSWFWNLE